MHQGKETDVCSNGENEKENILEKEKSDDDQPRCIGCGLCSIGCPLGRKTRIKE